MLDFGKLNSDQYDAVMHRNDKSALIISGAGTGKTTTVTYRIAKLISLDKIESQRILFLTFTKLASEELKSRVKKLTDIGEVNIAGGTFHSWTSSLLRKYGRLVGLSNDFTIMDTEDTLSNIRLIMARTRVLDRFKKDKTITATSDTIQSGLSSMKNNRESIEDTFITHSRVIPDIKLVINEYENAKHYKNMLDYDDLLFFAFNLLNENPDVLQRAGQYYNHVMVDEYQDTNFIQNDILKLLYSVNKNIFAVGDEAQSIYRFRGARVENILKFAKEFDSDIYKISTNYRSTDAILNFTNEFTKEFKSSAKKNLVGTSSAGKKVQYILYDDTKQEAKFICKKIIDMIEDTDAIYSDFAILSRASYLTNEIQVELTQNSIPYQVFGGIRFLERKHIKDIIAFVKIIENIYDDVSLHRVMLLLDGIGDKTIVHIKDHIEENSLYIDTIDVNKMKISNNKKEYVYNFFEILKEAHGCKNSLSDLLRVIITYYKSIAENITKSVEGDLKTLEKFICAYKSLEDFLQNYTLDYLSDGDNKPKITISTIHSAKGLEWNNVFIVGVKDGLFPNNSKNYKFEEREEEKRLFYVACTRAKTRLFLTATTDYFSSSIPKSSFIDKIGPKYLQYKIESFSNTKKRFM